MCARLADDLLSVLLPGRCPGCGGAPNRCARRARHRCAAARPARVPGVSWSVAVFAYEGVARELVARVKYRNERVAVRWLGARARARVRRARRSVRCGHVDPGERPRRVARGIDHGALLARAVSRRTRRDVERLARARPGSAADGSRRRRSAGPGPTLRASTAAIGSRRARGRRRHHNGRDLGRGGAMRCAACGARDVLAATVARTPRPADRPHDAAYTRQRRRTSERRQRSRG